MWQHSLTPAGGVLRRDDPLLAALLCSDGMLIGTGAAPVEDVALSLAEAELYGAVRVTSEVLVLMPMYQDLVRMYSSAVLGDASAALGATQEKRLRHMKTLAHMCVDSRESCYARD